MSLLSYFPRYAAGVCSRLRRAWFTLLGVQFDGRCWLQRVSIPRQWADIHIGEDAALDQGVTLICSDRPRHNKLMIGPRTYINRFTILDAVESLSIGEDCMIGPHCYLTDHDHGCQPGGRPGDQPFVSRPTRIGDRVWLGAHVVVLKGVTIGDDALVAAGAVVTKDVPSAARVAGVPARVMIQ